MLIKNSKKGKPKKTQTKRILNVAWFDTNFKKIELSPRGELISIAVLTEGYAIGDKIEVTIGSDDPTDESLIEGVDCKEITFVAKVNYKNIAFLQNIFTVEGEKEQMIIAPTWKEKYICK